MSYLSHATKSFDLCGGRTSNEQVKVTTVHDFFMLESVAYPPGSSRRHVVGIAFNGHKRFSPNILSFEYWSCLVSPGENINNSNQ